ncbi:MULTISPECIES: sn-glycerol-3-phosphate ABC transporter ATP-binding protein UgpC [Luteimonas]|uniref:sn-glycerol-3-phosphate ABC transporter ATP-binding protein UgpC n=1 Tax=Luteimonas chenhongjianii TaxID=2006110 RepID=A0A290XF23_9GAMM|nr:MULTISPECIES: sn-glycerol-3-phosphate ABC transporter ATP-binding protein UgpC [Luteimonas]ATD67735.1 sn-glycerol-3-phosphate ABC transporter ATP-binding protein UgpC [Luteimonas chenhongjianii]RPD88604.1 sn-glycerol-3-phosphate ABC transporter ATP-binding protein UgpC [Luteimonas sp. 100069]
MAQVRFDAVRKVYPNGFVGVAGASFEVVDGELLVLVGPSGCGKSTLLRMVAGLEAISDGTLTIGDRVVNDVAPKDRDIAMVFQSYALYPHMSVAENLAFGLKLRGQSKSEIAARVTEAAQMLELDQVLDRKPGQLSGGQRQRVALGRALVRQPQVFLLDEPLSNLDAKLRSGMRVEIARLHRKLGTTMIYVTHDQIEAMTLGQRIVVLKDGRIQQIDTPMALYERPANLFVATFLGSPAMNVLRGRLERDGRSWTLEAGDEVSLALGEAEFPPDWAGREVDLGIRPEHLLPAAAGAASLAPVVEVVEPVGSEVFANLRLGRHALIARLPPDRVPVPGETLPLSIPSGRVHAFDVGTGERLVPRA